MAQRTIFDRYNNLLQEQGVSDVSDEYKLGAFKKIGNDSFQSDAPAIAADFKPAAPAVFKIPQIDIPTVDITTPEGPQITTPQAPQITTPELPKVSVDVKAPDVLPNPNLTPPINFNFPDLQLPEVKNGVPLPDLSDIGSQISRFLSPVGEAASAVAKPIYDEAASLTEDVGGALSGTKVRAGDGNGYGEIKLGSGQVVDVSEKTEAIFNDLTKGSALEGSSGKDLFDLVTNPGKFAQEKGGQAAIDMATQLLGDNKMASDIFNSINEPLKGMQDAVGGAFSAIPGADMLKGVPISAGGIGKLLSGDIGGAAQQILQDAAVGAITDIAFGVLDGLAPGAGTVAKIATAILCSNKKASDPDQSVIDATRLSHEAESIKLSENSNFGMRFGYAGS